ncbi:hypothetical protein [Bacillus sp. 2205SS5-2]|uniref:hypothetical protein n=1 Tax=Bacillus sp. 2205SS5-2 TaxID=3109031 RepID=UPI0030070989
MNEREREELVTTQIRLQNAIISLYEHLAPGFKTRDFVILKYGLSSLESDKLEKFLIDQQIQKKIPTKKDIQVKLAEIQDLPLESIPLDKVEEIIQGYSSDGIMNKMLEKVLKS